MNRQLRKLLVSLLLLCSVASLAKERYNVQVLPDGNMYFFMPYKLKGSGSKLKYDMTLLTYRDSVTINMTLKSRAIGRVKSVSLEAGTLGYSTEDYELFFQEHDHGKVNTRVHIDCPMDIYRRMYTGASPLSITLTMTDGKRYTFTYGKSGWQQESTIIGQVFQMIDYGNSRK